MPKSNRIDPDFTEDLVAFMIQMMLTIVRFPRAPFAFIPLSKKEERIFGADARIEAIAPIYLQFKRPFAYPDYSTAKFIADRKKLKLSNDPRVLYFELRKKDKGHADFQHNILFNLRQALMANGVGDAVYTAPLFLNRTAYLLAVHFSSMIHCRPWHFMLMDDPFIRRELQLVTASGSIRFQSCPGIREHISIAPDQLITTHKHKYSYLEDGSSVCFHSPQMIETAKNLGQFTYDFLKFQGGQPLTPTVPLTESNFLLNQLIERCFGKVYDSATREPGLTTLDSWLNFGHALREAYDIHQYALLRFSEV